MKRVLQIAIIVFSALSALIVTGCLMQRDMPIKWYDEQGNQVVTVIEREFTIPIDSMSDREGVYHSGWAYLRDGSWNTGSTITIHGVKRKELQDDILKRITKIVKDEDFWDVQVVFYDDAKYHTNGNVIRRLDGPKLRSERIIGKTSPWR